MSNFGKIALASAAIIAVGAAGAYFGGFLGGDDNIIGGDTDSGIDVSATPCDGIGAARTAVNNEYQERIDKANTDYADAMEAASDAYWNDYNDLETAKYACETAALLADPCKDLFERSSALAQEILDDIDNGFDEAKAAEREQVKQEWEDCKANPPEEETYEGKKAKCEAEFSSGVALIQNIRDQVEGNAANAQSDALYTAEQAHTSKHATLDAIEEACKIPPPVTGVKTGGITTGGTGTVIESGNPACTGRFSGYDEDIQQEINRIQNLYNQAQAGGKAKGLGGTEALSAKLTDLRAEMATGPRYCEADSDCGDTTKICCSETQVGWVVCSGGECSTEKEDCEDDAICTGKPAQCVSPTTGLESQAINIQKSYTIGSTCSNKVQMLDLKQADENSDRFEIAGNVPDWLGFSHVGGKLPQPVDVTTACSQFTEPGTFTASVSITVYDSSNNLINTIPVNVTINVAGTAITEEEPKIKVGEDPIIEEEEPVSVAPGTINFTYDHANPRCPLPLPPVSISGPSGSTWSVVDELPVWLSMPARSGQVPAQVSLNFPCALDKYENQRQSATVPLFVTTPDGQMQEFEFEVNGNFTNF